MKSPKVILVSAVIGLTLALWFAGYFIYKRIPDTVELDQPRKLPSPMPSPTTTPTPSPSPEATQSTPSPTSDKPINLVGGGPTSRTARPSPNTSPPMYPDPTVPKWWQYREDEFYEVIWRWFYRAPDKTPRGIKPYCPECNPPTEMACDLFFPKTIKGAVGKPFLRLRCDLHAPVYRAEHIPNLTGDPFSKIKELIKAKLDDGSWEQVVENRRGIT